MGTVRIRRTGTDRGAMLMIAALAFIASPRPAVAERVTFFMTGLGKETCEHYLQASQGLKPNELLHHQKQERAFVSANAAYDHWVFGFLSAMNLAAAMDHNGKPNVRVTGFEIIDWVRNWCTQHQDASLFDATGAFMKDRWSRAPSDTPPAPGGDDHAR